MQRQNSSACTCNRSSPRRLLSSHRLSDVAALLLTLLARVLIIAVHVLAVLVSLWHAADSADFKLPRACNTGPAGDLNSLATVSGLLLRPLYYNAENGSRTKRNRHTMRAWVPFDWQNDWGGVAFRCLGQCYHTGLEQCDNTGAPRNGRVGSRIT